MKITKKFGEFTYEAAIVDKAKRILTGKSAGEEIDKLSKDQQTKLIELYKEDPMEAARFLRSIIIREKNSQFGIGLALTLAGSGMIWKGLNQPDPPPPPPVPEGEEYIVQKGDSFWKIAQEHLPNNASNKDVFAYMKQIASENGATHLYSGKSGAPGLDPDTWYDFNGNAVSDSVITDADRLIPGEKLILPDYSGNVVIGGGGSSAGSGSGGGAAANKAGASLKELQPVKPNLTPQNAPDVMKPVKLPSSNTSGSGDSISAGYADSKAAFNRTTKG